MSVHFTLDDLEAAGAYPVTPPNWWPLPSNATVLSIDVRYLKDGANGYPKLRVTWKKPSGEQGESVFDGDVTPSGSVIPLYDYELEIHCKSLLDKADAKTTRELGISAKATHVRVEPAEAGNVGAPGQCEIWLEAR